MKGHRWGFVLARTTTHRLKPALLKPAPDCGLKWGERPLGDGRSWGVGQNQRMLLSRSYRERFPGPVKLKKTRTANTEIEATTIIGIIGYGATFENREYDEQLQPRDHSARTLCARKWDQGYILFGTVVRYF